MERVFNFDLERMKKAVTGKHITIPPGMARGGQLRQFLRDSMHPNDLNKGPTVAEMMRGWVHG